MIGFTKSQLKPHEPEARVPQLVVTRPREFGG
jgi:hypothetical protein